MALQGKDYKKEMKKGFIAYQIGGEGRWRYSEFETIDTYDGLKVSMLTFKGNGYGHFYADSVEAKTRFYRVFDTLEQAERFATGMNNVRRGQAEDRRLIASGGRYM